jgi:hypothetical protein
MISEAKYAIWLHRNSIKFKGTEVNLQSLKFNLKYQLESHMTVLKLYYQNNNKLLQFTETFLQDNLFEINVDGRVFVNFFPEMRNN